ncbi:MAG: glycosyltransferase family A protein, partial [Candidatus Binatus sp.]
MPIETACWPRSTRSPARKRAPPPDMETERRIVSAIIPVFNGEATVAAAIDSALAQEFDGGVEVIVVNDGSTDATSTVIEAYRGRVTVLDRVNGGPAVARNAGVRAARGEYVAFLDADDIWMPRKLEKTLAALDRDSDAAMVYTNALTIGIDGEMRGATYTPAGEMRAPTMEDMLSG